MTKSFLNHIYDDPENECIHRPVVIRIQQASYKRCQIIVTYESLCIIQKVAVALSEIFFYLLKARMMAVSHLWPVRRFVTARVVLMAVDFIEIFFYLLKARLRAVSHLWPVRRFVTARVTKTAVSIRETTFYLLLVKISCKNVLPSLIIKISTSDCPQSYIFLCEGSRLG